MGGPKGIDWLQIKTEYVTTKTTYSRLSEKYGVSMHQIHRVSAREHWVDQRKKYIEKCFRKTETAAMKREAKRLDRLIAATTKAIDVAMGAFEDDQQFNRYIVTEGYGPGMSEVSEKVFAKVDTKALKDLTGVIKDLTCLMREFYNLPTAAQAEAQRIAAERLELEKRKADADTPDDGGIEIVFSDEMEKYTK
ncbi:MAG: hypothetical protein MJZ85_06655 [Bacteroidales bacterium]|nr:hypothetical protein [Bacteroidales bacterium]